MSKVEFRNLHHRSVVHLLTRRIGDLRLHDRVTTRGKGPDVSVATTFEAIFTFEDPFFCGAPDVPENGVYFMKDDGNAEVIQLSALFSGEEERTAWLSALFGIRPEQSA